MYVALLIIVQIGDSTWGDQLLTYGSGSTITYDEIGNPLSYRGFTFTWQRGRQLATVQGNGANLSFQYNADGLRVSKTSGSTTTDFSYASGLLVSQTDGTNTLHFTYDPDGVVLGVHYNGTDYYYLYNAQGDVIGLYNGSGALVVNYIYDSWGKLLSTTGSLAGTLGVANPLRYRGYYFDTETNLYLLESRYYDPEIGRFINADGELDNRSVSTTNLYAYCSNDPINAKDKNGHVPVWLVTGFVGAVVGGISAGLAAKRKGYKGKYFWASVGIGTVVGFAVGVVSGISPSKAKTAVTVGKMFFNGVMAATGNLVQQRIHYSYSKTKRTTKTSSRNYASSSQKSGNFRSNNIQPEVKTFRESIDWKSAGTSFAAGALSAIPSNALGDTLTKELGVNNSVFGASDISALSGGTFSLDITTSALQSIIEHTSVSLFQ